MLALLIDENLNHRILRGLLRSLPHLDYTLATGAGLKGEGDPAVLDFAATVCKPRTPLCNTCPVAPRCSYANTIANSAPRRAVRGGHVAPRPAT